MTPSPLPITVDSKPQPCVRYLFWAILGIFSTFFAEVCSGSSPLAFTDLWGILMVTPLYTMHILILAWVVFKATGPTKPTLTTLYLAGMVFGLYEAYITKVLWHVPWGELFTGFYGVSITAFGILVVFWHPIMSFMVPLFTAEGLLTNKSDMFPQLPERVKRLFSDKKKYVWALVALAVIFGMQNSCGTKSPLVSLLSGLTTTGILALCIWVWLYKANGRRYSMRELLPEGNEVVVIFAMLVVLYTFSAFFILPQFLPGLLPQALIWTAYGIIGSLLYVNLRLAPRETDIKIPCEASSFKMDWKLYAILAGTFTITSMLASLWIGFGYIMMFILWIFGVGGGLLLLGLVLKRMLHHGEPARPPGPAPTRSPS